MQMALGQTETHLHSGVNKAGGEVGRSSCGRGPSTAEHQPVALAVHNAHGSPLDLLGALPRHLVRTGWARRRGALGCARGGGQCNGSGRTRSLALAWTALQRPPPPRQPSNESQRHGRIQNPKPLQLTGHCTGAGCRRWGRKHTGRHDCRGRHCRGRWLTHSRQLCIGGTGIIHHAPSYLLRSSQQPTQRNHYTEPKVGRSQKKRPQNGPSPCQPQP